MRDLGFVQLSAEPVVTDPSMPYAINEEDLPRVFSEYDKLCDVMANRTEDKFNFFHFMVDLNAGPCAITRLRLRQRLRCGGASRRYLPLPPVRWNRAVENGQPL